MHASFTLVGTGELTMSICSTERWRVGNETAVRGPVAFCSMAVVALPDASEKR